MRRFESRYQKLDADIKKRLVIENDERLYSVEDVLQISANIGAPVVFDNLHHDTKCPNSKYRHNEILSACAKTWRLEDGRPKIHYSQQAPGKRPGAHANSVDSKTFVDYFREIHGEAFDIMIEGKDKNISVVKCILLTDQSVSVKRLQDQWRRYKYYVMERAPDIYRDIQRNVFSVETVRASAFFERIEAAERRPVEPGHAENAALHVWGYFSKQASEHEKKRFFALIKTFREGQGSIEACKRHLLRLAEKYSQRYLLDSLYFYIKDPFVPQ